MGSRGGDIVLADSGAVRAVALSPDESLLAVAREYAVEICDAATTRPLRVLAGHTGAVRALAFSPSGERLVTSARDGTVRVWDVRTGGVTLTVDVEYPGAVCFFPDGERVAVGAGLRDLLVVDAAGRTTTLGSGGGARSLGFSPDGTLLLAVEDGGGCRVYEVATGRVRLDLPRGWRRRRRVVGAAFTTDGSAVTLVDESGAVRVRDLADGRARVVAGAVLQRPQRIEEVVLPGGGAQVIVSAHNIVSRLDIRDAATGAVTAALGGVDGLVTALAAGRRRIVVGVSEGLVHVWDRPGEEPVVTDRVYDPVWDVRISADGKFLATQDNNGDVHLWEVATGRVRDRFAGDLYRQVGVAFTPDGTGLAIAGLKSPPQVRDVAGDRVRLTLDHPPDTTSAMYFSPDGRRLLTVDRDKLVRVWDAATGRLERQHGAAPDKVAWSPDGDSVALISFSQISMWHLPSRRVTTLFESPSQPYPKVSKALAFSPDGRMIAAVGERADIWIWPREGGPVTRVLRTGLNESLALLAFSPDGARLAVAPFNGAPRILDAVTGAVVREFPGHYSRVLALTFGSDGATLVTASADGTARQWDAATGAPMTTFVPLPGGEGAAILPDGRIVGHGAGQRIWRVAGAGLDE
jgi:WD40 repeat protein